MVPWRQKGDHKRLNQWGFKILYCEPPESRQDGWTCSAESRVLTSSTDLCWLLISTRDLRAIFIWKCTVTENVSTSQNVSGCPTSLSTYIQGSDQEDGDTSCTKDWMSSQRAISGNFAINCLHFSSQNRERCQSSLYRRMRVKEKKNSSWIYLQVPSLEGRKPHCLKGHLAQKRCVLWPQLQEVIRSTSQSSLI